MLWLEGFFWGFMGAMILWISSLFGVYLILVKARIGKMIDDRLSVIVNKMITDEQINDFSNSLHSTPLTLTRTQTATPNYSTKKSSFVSPQDSLDYKQELDSKNSIDELIKDL